MKRLTWIFILIGIVCIVHAQNYQGSIATTDFITDLTILQDDNTTGVPDDWLCHIVLPGTDGLIDPPNSDGSPGGDDFLVTGVPGNNFYEFGWDSSWTGIQGQHYGTAVFLWFAAGQGTEPCANADENFYLRLFDDPIVSGATKYLNSALFSLPAAMSDLYFNTIAHWDYETQFNWQNITDGAPGTD